MDYYVFRRVMWLCLGVLMGGWLAAYAGAVRAETIAATATPNQPNTEPLRYAVNYSGNTKYTTLQAACTAENNGLNIYIAVVTSYNNVGCSNSRYTNGAGGLSGWVTCTTGVGVSSVGGSASCGAAITTYSCPAGQDWALSGSSCTRPDCVAPATRDPANGQCVTPSCVAKTVAAALAWFDVGISPDAGKRFSCVGGCLALYSGDDVSKSSLVDGVRHYYRMGSYTFTGSGAVDVCTASATIPETPLASSDVPVPHCASNQIEGLINGKLNCWNVPTVAGEPPTLATTSAPLTATTASGSTTVATVGDTTTTTTTNIDNSTGATTVNTTSCVGLNCTTTTQQTSSADPTESAEENIGSPVAGALPATGELVQADERTLQSVWNGRKAELLASPLVGLAASLTSFPGGVGACPSWTVEGSIFGTVQGGTIAPPCWIWSVLRAFLMLTTLFLARRLIFGG